MEFRTNNDAKRMGNIGKYKDELVEEIQKSKRNQK